MILKFTNTSKRTAFARGFIDGFGALGYIYRPVGVTSARRLSRLVDNDRMNVQNDFVKIVRRVDVRAEKTR
jgi:hypothetical protein